MIVTQLKKPAEILDYLQNRQKIYLVGCGLCATTCQTGGEKELKEAGEWLKQEGKQIIGEKVIEEPCDLRQVRIAVANLSAEPDWTFLVFSCGVGVQNLSDFFPGQVIPALDTIFLGKIERLGFLKERCHLCGDCQLAHTAGICPVSRCPKGLLNGPCGGMDKGKCESNPEAECVWFTIWERLRSLKRETIWRELPVRWRRCPENTRPRQIMGSGKEL